MIEKRFYGKGVCGAYGIGKISIFQRESISVKRMRIDDILIEIERFEKAKEIAKSQIEKIYQKALTEVGETNAQIFEIHKMMIDDEDYNDSVLEIIKNQSINAEYAVATTSDNFSQMFESMEDGYMKARAADVKDISNRIIKILTSESEVEYSENEKVIICADDLSPSETVLLDKESIIGFITARGASNSHTAILARSLNIPAVIEIGESFFNYVSDKTFAIIDGYSGEVILNPSDSTIKEYEEKKSSDEADKALLKKLCGKENVTLDGTKINIYANIGSVEEVGSVLVSDADGIGLFRSEFLYLNNSDYPSEDEQFLAYKKVLENMGGKKVIIRTLDIGADKQAQYFHLKKEENPAMGMRAIRICLTKPQIFKTQLRALYRASVFGNLGIMFPMITSVDEIWQIKNILNDVKRGLDCENISYSNDMEIGIMIETPAAAVISDKLAGLVDFFSIGTNDLTQYTLACDRQNSDVEQFCDIHHESIMRLIEYVTKNAHENGIWVGICGELAADTSLTKKFLKIGIDELSVSPSFVLRLRDTVRKIDLK